MPHPAVQDIQTLQQATSNQVAVWHHALVSRRSPAAPRWLELCAHAVPHLSDAAQLKALLGQSADVNDLLELDPVTAQVDPWHEPPGTQLHRVGAAVMQALGGKAALPEPTPGLDGTQLAIQADWLRDAARLALHEPDPALRWQAPAAAPGTADVHAHALLVTWQQKDPDAWVPRGVLAHLQLRVVPVPKTEACLRLVPMPRSACTALSHTFAQALEHVRDWLWTKLRHDVPGLDLTHLALAWDLHFERPHGAQEDGVSNLAGPSAGVVFALAALQALQAAAPPDLAGLLARLPMDALFDLWATAALAPDGTLAPVGGTGAKGLALAPLLQALVDSPAGPHTACVHVASGQQQLAGSLAGAPPLVEHPSINDLLRDLPARLEPPDTAAERLHRLLLADDPRPQPADADLRHATGAMPTPTLARWLLKQWSTWALREGGQVHAHYVRLQVRRNARPGHAAVPEGAPRELPALLSDYDGTGHLAYVLRGQPGAGKSTLLRHHLMDLSRAALRRLHQPGQSPITLPLYLPLARLPADDDPPQWVRKHLQAAGAPAELRAWFSPGARRPANCCLRLLLDGINELPVRDGQERHERAAEVVSALHTVLAAAHDTVPLPPMLLSIRQHHADNLAGVDLMWVDVLDWDDAEVQAYLQLRFPTPPGTPNADAPWRRRWAELTAPGNAAALAMCRVPLNLAGQCDLWDAGYPHPVQYRAALYTAWLWLRLRRALGYGPGLSAEAVQAGRQRAIDWRRLGLLSQRDTLRITSADAWLDPHPANLPLEGTLLQHLLQQAEEQYWNDAREGRRAGQRCATIQPLTRVAPWITDAGAHAQWRTAVAELGLAVVDEAAASFEYAHPSWGEFLASVRLLAGDPPAWAPGLPATAWQRLLGRAPRVDLPPTVARLHAACLAARWPGPNDRGDAEELAHLAAHGSTAWQRVLPKLQELATTPLSVPLDDLVFHMMMAPLGRSREAPMSTRRQHKALLQTIQWDANAELCHVDLRAWGDTISANASFDKQEQGSWIASSGSWQTLALEGLWPPVRKALWSALAQKGVDDDTLQQLRNDAGRLGQPPVGDIDEVLALAVTGLADPAPWLAWLLAAGHGPRLGPAVATLAARLEPEEAVSGATHVAANGVPPAPRPWREPHCPVLQHWRRLLLLRSLDAGGGLHRRLRAGGWWTVLNQPLPDLPPLLQAHWPQALRKAFRSPGLDLRLRLQAADWLSTLGDTLRLQWAQGTVRAGRPGSQPVAGLRLHPALWVPMGKPGRSTRFVIGAPWFAHHPRERPVFVARLPGFAAAAQPVTLQEWQIFAANGGYDPQAPWWHDAGATALAWLANEIGHGRNPKARFEDRAGFCSKLQPVTGISLFEAKAYAHWASALQPAQPGVHQPLQVPTEVQWEAMARGPANWWQVLWPSRPWQPWGWTHRASIRPPAALEFNHAATRLGCSSAVGVFCTSLSPKGLTDLAGNVWERCSSVLESEQRARGWNQLADQQTASEPCVSIDRYSHYALRGGAYSYSAKFCRPAARDHHTPYASDDDIGVRLVRLWLPN